MEPEQAWERSRRGLDNSEEASRYWQRVTVGSTVSQATRAFASRLGALSLLASLPALVALVMALATSKLFSPALSMTGLDSSSAVRASMIDGLAAFLLVLGISAVEVAAARLILGALDGDHRSSLVLAFRGLIRAPAYVLWRLFVAVVITVPASVVLLVVTDDGTGAMTGLIVALVAGTILLLWVAVMPFLVVEGHTAVVVQSLKAALSNLGKFLFFAVPNTATAIAGGLAAAEMFGGFDAADGHTWLYAAVFAISFAVGLTQFFFLSCFGSLYRSVWAAQERGARRVGAYGTSQQAVRRDNAGPPPEPADPGVARLSRAAYSLEKPETGSTAPEQTNDPDGGSPTPPP